MPTPRASRSKLVLLCAAPIILILALVGCLAARSALESYLRSERFRALVAAKAGESLHGQAEIGAVHFDGASVYAARVAAQGGPDAAFAQLEADGLRGEVSFRRVLARAWQINQVEVQRVRVDLGGPRLALPPPPPAEATKPPEASGRGWLPDRVEVTSAMIREMEAAWEGGGLRGVALELRPEGEGWSVQGAGGKLTYENLPALEVQRLDLRYRPPMLFVQSAEFRQGAQGAVTAHGEIELGRQMEIHATLRDIALTPYLAGDWRLRLKGDASGEITVRSPLPLTGPPAITGTLTLSRGELEALPVLDEIAAFTHAQQFRHLTLNRASGEFTQQGSHLTVRNFLLETEGLIRVEGLFAVNQGQIDGTFQVGVTPASLQWLPGSQARVFTEARGGYLWAPMRLTGPVESPHEDLSQRLVAAAGGAAVETLQETVKEGAKTLQNAAKGLLDSLLPSAR